MLINIFFGFMMIVVSLVEFSKRVQNEILAKVMPTPQNFTAMKEWRGLINDLRQGGGCIPPLQVPVNHCLTRDSAGAKSEPGAAALSGGTGLPYS
jgi:hypothetical protein